MYFVRSSVVVDSAIIALTTLNTPYGVNFMKVKVVPVPNPTRILEKSTDPQPKRGASA